MPALRSLTRAGLLALALVGAPASAAPARTPAKPDTPPTPPAASPAALPAGPGDFTAFEDALKAGNKAAATNALLVIVDDPAQAGGHGRAWRSLAAMLESEGLEVAALTAYARGIEADPKGSGADMAHVLELAAKVSDEALIAPVLGRNVGIDGLDTETRSKMAYLAARDHLRNDNLGTALAILMMVESGTKVYADAESLRGVVLANQGRFQDALAPLLTAQGAAKQVVGEDPEEQARFQDVIDLNVARAYYGAENWGQAITWFAQVDRASEYWPEAQFERAWAHFRADDMQGALGLLLNHDSPFFDGWYFPEADLLRAYSLFMMCKFPSATEEMDEFVATYTPVRADAQRLSAMGAAEAFAETRAFVDGGPSKIPAMVLRDFRNDDRFEEAVGAIAAIEAEQQELGRFGGEAYARRAGEWLAARKDAIVAEEGGRVVARLQRARTELDEMLQGIEITRLDLLALETEMYERAAATGKLDYGDRIGKLRNLRKTRKGFRVWPFEGEFWADELGWYVVDTRPDCPESMAAGEGK